MKWEIYSFRQNNLLMFTDHEYCNMAIGVEAKCDSFLYPTKFPMEWSMEKRNIFSGIPNEDTALTGHVQ